MAHTGFSLHPKAKRLLGYRPRQGGNNVLG